MTSDHRFLPNYQSTSAQITTLIVLYLCVVTEDKIEH